MLDVGGFEFFSDVIRKLGSAIPNKTKFVVCCESGARRRISEALQVSGDFLTFSRLVEILNKRWQTLDLVSMVQELRRHSYVRGRYHWLPDAVSFQDTLSSLPRFKRAEDLS